MTTPRVHRRRRPHGAETARSRLLAVAEHQGWLTRVQDPKASFEKNGVVVRVEYTASGIVRAADRLIGDPDGSRRLDRIGKGTTITRGLDRIIQGWLTPHEDPVRSTEKGRG